MSVNIIREDMGWTSRGIWGGHGVDIVSPLISDISDKIHNNLLFSPLVSMSTPCPPSQYHAGFENTFARFRFPLSEQPSNGSEFSRF